MLNGNILMRFCLLWQVSPHAHPRVPAGASQLSARGRLRAVSQPRGHQGTMEPLDPRPAARSRGLPQGTGHGPALLFRGRGRVKAPNRERVMKEVTKGQVGMDGSISGTCLPQARW